MTANCRAPRAAAGSGGARNDNLCIGVEQQATAHVAGLRRRRAAAWRCPPVGGRRDPLDLLPAPRRLTFAELDAWAAAVDHLAEHGHDVTWCVPDDVAELLAAAS
ncbi:hypothetical protein ACU61A_22160 [Pseudonocardia sichuanensis]